MKVLLLIKMKHSLLFLFLIFSLQEVSAAEPKATFKADAAIFASNLKKLTDVMVQDVTGPCAAARYYTYANLLAYEIINQQQPERYSSLKDHVHDYPDLSKEANMNSEVDVNLAVLYGVLKMGEELLPSGMLLEEERQNLLKEAKKHKLNKNVIAETVAYTDKLVERFVEYAQKDGYFKTSGLMKYTPLKAPGSWQPTPPGYMEAYEPHWSTIRPFLIDSATQFKPIPAVEYSEEEGSSFIKLVNEVYETTNHLTDEQKLIANYWDCNPFFLNQKGHISFGTKKISPGAHWIGITGLISQNKNLDFAETVKWHTLVSLTMADAFLSCWQEKYNSNRIRPETFINEKIDREWRPLLQTPPFPEYTSGHSVVSSSVAEVLTALAGDNFKFIDDVEVEYGLPERSFTSFRQAASEAAISRFYGGIHFKDAVDNGAIQGEQIGKFVIEKLKL